MNIKVKEEAENLIQFCLQHSEGDKKLLFKELLDSKLPERQSNETMKRKSDSLIKIILIMLGCINLFVWSFAILYYFIWFPKYHKYISARSNIDTIMLFLLFFILPCITYLFVKKHIRNLNHDDNLFPFLSLIAPFIIPFIIIKMKKHVLVCSVCNYAFFDDSIGINDTLHKFFQNRGVVCDRCKRRYCYDCLAKNLDGNKIFVCTCGGALKFEWKNLDNDLIALLLSLSKRIKRSEGQKL